MRGRNVTPLSGKASWSASMVGSVSVAHILLRIMVLLSETKGAAVNHRPISLTPSAARASST